MRAAVRLVVACALSLADGKGATVGAGAPRGRRATPDRRVRSGSAPASSAAAARSRAGSRRPKKFGCWKMTHAASADLNRARRDRSLRDAPPRPRRGRSQVRTSSPPGAPAGSGSRTGRPSRVDDVLRDEAGVGSDRDPVVARRVLRHVHPRELADHGLVLEDRLQDTWLISGWYGVYAVRNSPRESTASTTAGT